jgi:hypothetical protein
LKKPEKKSAKFSRYMIQWLKTKTGDEDAAALGDLQKKAADLRKEVGKWYNTEDVQVVSYRGYRRNFGLGKIVLKIMERAYYEVSSNDYCRSICEAAKIRNN